MYTATFNNIYLKNQLYFSSAYCFSFVKYYCNVVQKYYNDLLFSQIQLKKKNLFMQLRVFLYLKSWYACIAIQLYFIHTLIKPMYLCCTLHLFCSFVWWKECIAKCLMWSFVVFAFYKTIIFNIVAVML